MKEHEQSFSRVEQPGSTSEVNPPTFGERFREFNYKLAQLTRRRDRFWVGLMAVGSASGVAGAVVFGSRLALIAGAGLVLWGGIGLQVNHDKHKQR